MPNGALLGRGRGRASVEPGPPPALWRSALSSPYSYTDGAKSDHVLQSAPALRLFIHEGGARDSSGRQGRIGDYAEQSWGSPSPSRQQTGERSGHRHESPPSAHGTMNSLLLAHRLLPSPLGTHESSQQTRSAYSAGSPGENHGLTRMVQVHHDPDTRECAGSDERIASICQ